MIDVAMFLDMSFELFLRLCIKVLKNKSIQILKRIARTSLKFDLYAYNTFLQDEYSITFFIRTALCAQGSVPLGWKSFLSGEPYMKGF